ncbi:DNA helicase [Anaerocolumna sp. AGMB13025]|uniref:DNA helicase n=1 Tax=Anaerocolumna sp. AGMB13025 TaxID=3039116 RepID=UPI00241E147D|nr:DNA helicase [Anaerocolumna sp. AGMB13025]WFR57277.1 DNA helicase [Anaerocolumna sp. AGMB13025]
MIQEIKRIVENYLNNAKLCSILPGTVTADGIQISDKLTIPEELIIGNLKLTAVPGDKVRLIRNHGGQQYYILEVIK